MIKKYIVSIEQSHSPRLQSFLNQEAIKPLISEFKIVGFNAYQQSAKDYFQEAVLGREKPLTLGEWGCVKSHLMCLHDFLESDAKYALIFEDDALQVCDVDLSQLFVQVEQLNLISPFLLSLGGIQMKICDKARGHLLKQQIYKRNILHVSPYFYNRIHYTYAYVVDRKMAEILIHHQQPLHVYDHFQDLSRESVNFYMSFVFDHPDLSQQSHMSYLEQERMVKVSKKQGQCSPRDIMYHIEKYRLQKYKVGS